MAATEHGRACIKACREILKSERDPFGRDWNNETTAEERKFWLEKARQPVHLAKVVTWAELPEVTRHALKAALVKAASRAAYLLQGAAA